MFIDLRGNLEELMEVQMSTSGEDTKIETSRRRRMNIISFMLLD